MSLVSTSMYGSGEDGYQTERSYSIGSPPEQSTIELTVERIDDGEV